MVDVTPWYSGADAQIDRRLGVVESGSHPGARRRPLRWVGQGLAGFGVPAVTAGAELTEDQVDMGRRLIRGQHIGTGEQLVRYDFASIAGYDIVITLPKSMSVLLAMSPDDLGERIEGVYVAATHAIFTWAEDRTSFVQRGPDGGGEVVKASGFSGWVLTDPAAAPVGDAAVGDPDWHAHFTIANMGEAEDGTWLPIAADGQELMHHASTIDALVQAQIRGELHREFGIGFALSDQSGLWEVEHIPQAVLDLFSKRQQQTTPARSQLGGSPVAPRRKWFPGWSTRRT